MNNQIIHSLWSTCKNWMVLLHSYPPPPVKLAPANLTSTDPGANFGGGGNLTGTAEGANFQTRTFSEKWGPTSRGGVCCLCVCFLRMVSSSVQEGQKNWKTSNFTIWYVNKYNFHSRFACFFYLWLPSFLALGISSGKSAASTWRFSPTLWRPRPMWISGRYLPPSPPPPPCEKAWFSQILLILPDFHFLRNLKVLQGITIYHMLYQETWETTS